jgi:L-fuculose-phosphate aldolase
MAKLEYDIIRWGKILFERRLISGWGGNLSCRLGKNEFLITGQHAPLGFLARNDLVRIAADGKPIRKYQRASSETPMHLAVYAGTDAQAIVHVHPPMVLAFSLAHESFVPVSFEEKYTIGEVPIIPQDTPTVTKPEKVVEELKYHPVVIVKGHGTVAIGKDFQEAFLFTDLLEQAVHCEFFKDRLGGLVVAPSVAAAQSSTVQNGTRLPLFSKQHMQALVDNANQDAQFRAAGAETGLTTSLTLLLEESGDAWTVHFTDGAISDLQKGDDGNFLISGKAEWWTAVFSNRIDAFLATQQGKLQLQRGELAQLSRWYKPFQRAFAIWQTIPVQ